MKKGRVLRTVVKSFLWSVMVVLLQGAAGAGERDTLLAKLESRDPREQTLAVNELRKRSDDETVYALMKIVEGRRDDWNLQIVAIRLLGEIANPVSTDLLMKVVTDGFFTNECPALKWNGIVALGSFKGDPRVADALLYRLGEDTLYLREAVVESLGRIGDRQALPYLIGALKDKHFSVRMAAIKAVAGFQAPETAPVLREIAANDADPLLRAEAQRALSRLK